MKKTLIIALAAVAVMATGCRRIVNQLEDVTTYPTTAEEVAQMAKDYHCDAALVVTKADTQYVLYRRQGGESCYCMRYVSEHRCRHDFRAVGGEFRLGEPQQSLVVNCSGNVMTLSLDSMTIDVTDITVTDSALTFRFGFDTADREAVLYLYGNACGIGELLSETSIQQMLVLALGLDGLIEETEEDMAEAREALEEAERDIELAGHNLEQVAQAQAFGERYAEYSRLDSLASALGFANKEANADDNHLTLKVWGGMGGSKKCYARMERMAEEAKNCHTSGYSIQHNALFNHKHCTFTVTW